MAAGGGFGFGFGFGVDTSVAVLAFLLLSTVGSGQPEWPSGDGGAIQPSMVQRLSTAQLEFSLDLYKTVVGGSGGVTAAAAAANDSVASDDDQDVDVDNVIMSPYSVMSVLSMLYLGSSGATSEQLRRALRLGNMSYVEVHRSYKKIVDGFRNGKTQVNVTVANKIFVQTGVNVSKVYGDKLLEYYDASLTTLDFASDASLAGDLVNAWVRVHTRGKIDRLLDRPPQPTTKLLLANAVHFQGYWLNRFDRKRTTESSAFRATARETLSVPMMVGRLRVPHGRSQSLGCAVLELPYLDRRLSMFVLLPDDDKKPEALRHLEAALNVDVVAELVSDLKEDVVNVRLPRFQVESQLRLKEYLVRMGLTDLFVRGEAGLSGLTGGGGGDNSDIYVDDVAHRAVVTVSEDGSEAAAATGLDVKRIGYVGESYFEVDRPFVFFVWDRQINVLLFVGRVTRPSMSTSTTSTTTTTTTTT